MKTINDAAQEYAINKYEGCTWIIQDTLVDFKAGVELATNWNKINIADIKTFPEENEPILVKDGNWLFVGVRYGSAFFTDGDSIEIINNFEWRLINFK